jgi:hypothetical protein
VKYAGGSGPYAQQDGTSFAAPQISGEVALIYQSVCDTFLYLAAHQPDSAAGLMKAWIMKGTDSLSALNGKCVTAGRVNSMKFWAEMNAWCNSNDRTYGVHENEKPRFNIFPNPVKAGEPFFISGNFLSKNYLITITDISGRLISCKAEEDDKGNVFIPTNDLQAGYYLVHIHAGGSNLVRKLFIY